MTTKASSARTTDAERVKADVRFAAIADDRATLEAARMSAYGRYTR